MTVVLLIPVPVPVPVVACVGVTVTGHRLLAWRRDEDLFEVEVENHGWCWFSFCMGGVNIDGEWHETEASPAYESQELLDMLERHETHARP